MFVSGNGLVFNKPNGGHGNMMPHRHYPTSMGHHGVTGIQSKRGGGGASSYSSKGTTGGGGGGGSIKGSMSYNQGSSKSSYQVSQGVTSKGNQKVGGTFHKDRSGVSGVNLSTTMHMRMNMNRNMNMGVKMNNKPTTTTQTATVSRNGGIIFHPDDNSSNTGELKTKFTGTLIGYQAFT
jgi:hypothetical protein